MLRTVFAVVTLLVFGSIQADVIEVGDTGVTFDAPEEFKPLPKEIIEAKWPNRNGPRFVIGNERGTTTIAYDVKSEDLSNADFDELRAAFEQTFDRVIPGIQWKANRVFEHDGKQWIYLEMTSNAIDTDIYNIVMLTGVEQRMVIFNFNSTKEDFPKYENVLRQSLASIRVR